MIPLSSPYRCTPADARCYYRNGRSCYFHSLHQKNLFLRHFSPGNHALLALRLLCRTLALPGDWHRRIHPDFLNVMVVHSGETFVRIDNESFLAEPGDVVLLPPNADYEFGSKKNSERSGIVVQGELVQPILRHLNGQLVFRPRNGLWAEDGVERFFASRDIPETQLNMWSYEALAALEPLEEETASPIPLKMTLERMKKQLEKRLCLDSLARECGMTARSLTRLFRKFLQVSPHQCLMKMRMEKARQMLAMEEFSIKEIAISTGYPNALNFSTAFRKYFHCSPSEYRCQNPEKHEEI